MSVLTDSQVAMLAEAAVLIGAHRSVLSEFELELMADVGSRFGRFRRHAIVTPLEWSVFHTGLEAMKKAQASEDARRAGFLARTRAA